MTRPQYIRLADGKVLEVRLDPGTQNPPPDPPKRQKTVEEMMKRADK